MSEDLKKILSETRTLLEYALKDAEKSIRDHAERVYQDTMGRLKANTKALAWARKMVKSNFAEFLERSECFFVTDVPGGQKDHQPWWDKKGSPVCCRIKLQDDRNYDYSLTEEFELDRAKQYRCAVIFFEEDEKDGG